MKLSWLGFVLGGLAGVAGAGCGSRGGVAGDGGVDAGTKVTGRHSFDVVATLAGPDGGIGPSSDLPTTNAFTLVLDADAHQAIVGGKGHAATVAATSSDGRTFHLGAFTVGVTGDGSCNIGTLVEYRSLDVTVSETALQGRADGSAQISCGDCSFNVPFTAEVTGAPDVTSPFLSLSGGSTTGPFAQPSFIASEPLPTTARAWLRTESGDKVDLVPITAADEPSLVIGFHEPNVLPPSDGFTVEFDGLTDFAGRTGGGGPPLRLEGFAAPLVPEDGFEGETKAQVGGAAVLVGASAPLTPISGNVSAFIGNSNVPAIPGVKFGSSLNVRLAVHPGDTKVRFSYRMLANGGTATLDLGAVGHAPSATQTIGASVAGTPTSWLGKTVNVSGTQTQESALPADATSEVVVSIQIFAFNCGPFVSQDVAALLIDDLAVE
jgi:hypothetical protein